MFVDITWPPEAISTAIVVYILRHKDIDLAAMFLYIPWLWRQSVGGGDAEVDGLLLTFSQK